MYQTRQAMTCAVAIILLFLTALSGRAQEASTAKPACNPCISHPHTQAESDAYRKWHEEYCKTHSCDTMPDKRGWDYMRAVQDASKRNREMLKKQHPDAFNKRPQPGHSEYLYGWHDPDKTFHSVSIPDTWIWPEVPQDGGCYSNPRNPTEIRCVPTEEQQKTAD